MVNVESTILDYFLTTNLLFPGEYVFRPNGADEDGKPAIAVPRDTIIFGNINKSGIFNRE